jgi:hypothetical protein
MFSKGSCFPLAVGSPFICGRICHTHVNNAAFLEFNDYEDIHGVKEPIIDDSEIASPNITYVILDKSGPIPGHAHIQIRCRKCILAAI